MFKKECDDYLNFFKTIETYIIFNLQLHFDNKSLFSLLFFLPGSQIKARTGGRVYEVFCDVRQLCHPLEISTKYFNFTPTSLFL